MGSNVDKKIDIEETIEQVEAKQIETDEKINESKKESKSPVWKCVLSISFIVLSVALVYLLIWSKYIFGNVPFAQILYHITVPLAGTDTSIVSSYFIGVAPWVALSVVIMILMAVMNHFWKKNCGKEPKKFWGRVWKRIQKINGFLVKRKFKISSIILIIVLVVNFFGFGIHSWLYGRFDSSTIFEDYYVDAATANIKAPEKKKNLIFILSESLEASYSDPENGGCMDKNYIPRLTELAKANTHFSRNESLAGAIEVDGTGWTMASMVAQTTGVPLMIPARRNAYGKYAEFLPGITSMGEILEQNGYVNELLIGSKKEFAGVDKYFGQHGNYEIFDFNTAMEKEYVMYHNGFWGIEDWDLFQIARDEVSRLASGDQPFNIMINTIDLHTPGGYRCLACGYEHEDNYQDIISCQDRLITKFVAWCEEQDFYEDTVIVVAGDHLSMAPIVKNEYTPDGYSRSAFNAIINSDLEPVNATNRLFTTMDMFPTILASLGFEIEGNRLGLGTNLYSEEKTVMETVGKKEFMEEISKNSKLYNKEILELK